MKVLQLIDSLSIGGAERMSVNIANVLADKRIESYLIASRGGGPLEGFLKPAVAFCSLNKKNGLDIFSFYRLLKLVKKIKPNIIHAHSTSIFWGIGIKLFNPSIKVLWHDHYGLSDSLKDNDRFWERFFSRWMDAVIVVNEKLEIWCKKNLKVSKKAIVYLTNFPYLPKVENIPATTKNILLNLANFRPQKDQLNLLDAISIVKKSGLNFELWLAGALVDKSWLEQVKQKIQDLDLTDLVKILGPVENAAVILSRASIGILSSESEGLPVALLEYGLAGLPVICTDTGQCKEVLGNGSFGMVVPPKNPAALATAIMEMINNKPQAIKMGEAFNKVVAEQYGSGTFLKAYLDLINNID
jgi:glycosyltransferase involved in cell wall biosynthesis